MKNTSYKRLLNFLGAWFPDMDLENLTEKDIVKEYKKSVSPEEINAMIVEAEDILNKIENYWKTIEHETNLYFENPEQTRLWLKNIIALLKSY